MALWFNEDLPFEIEQVAGLLDIVGIDARDPLESWVKQDSDNVVIHTDFQTDDTIILEDVSIDDLSESDFIFAGWRQLTKHAWPITDVLPTNVIWK